MQTAIGYVRVSTEGQAKEGVSLEAQQRKIEAWCLANDLNLMVCSWMRGFPGSEQTTGLNSRMHFL
jgi:site-specific DNA recombinase